MTALVERINEYFSRYGWHFEYDESTSTWITGFRGESHNFNILVHLTENWLYFIVGPFVNAPQNEACEIKLNRFLLRLNHTINMAKFSTDNEGDIILTVEVPTESLSYSEFCDGLNAISYYSDGHYLDVANLARDQEYVPMDKAVEEWVPSNSGLAGNNDKPN